ncbi:MAG TPA: hypothetical protein EYP71_02905 [Dehalococcoidia bacterium]|nr:hypothetical protein [Dehalococcoidia bacterium]
MSKRVFLILLILGVLLVFGSTKAALGESTKYVDEFREITTQIKLLNLINGLELDREQMRFIIDKAEEAKQLKADFLASVNEDSPEATEVLQTLQELRDKLLRGENISDDLKEQVHRASGMVEEARMEYQNEITQLALEIKEILEPHQLYTLEHYVPCLIAPKPGAAGQAGGTEGIVRQLTRLREMPEAAFEDRKEKIAQRVIEHMKRHLPKGYMLDEEAEKEWLIAFAEEVRSLSEADFALKKTELAEELKSRHALPKLPIDVSVKIERFLLNPEIIPLLESKLASGTP